MAAALRVDPKDFFSPERMGGAVDAARPGGGCFWWRHCWATILAAGALFVLWPNPFTLILAVMVIGARQLGLAILMHDAAHAALAPGP